MHSKRRKNGSSIPAPRWYRGADIPMRLIRQFARQVAERFQPDKIILFGSYAYGTPHADSDVDILVIMPARNQLDQAAKISIDIDPPFPLDIIVRTPHNMKWRLAEGESFLTEVTTKGKVLYEKNHARVGPKSRKRLPARRHHSSGKQTTGDRRLTLGQSRARCLPHDSRSSAVIPRCDRPRWLSRRIAPAP